MLIAFISVKISYIFVQLFCAYLPVFLSDRQDFMTCVLNSSCLMHAYMSAFCSNYTLMIREHCRYNNCVCLSPTDKKFDLYVFANGLFNLLCRPLTVHIAAIAGQALHVRLRKSFEDFRVGTTYIVALK